eukprot:492595-Lingulodinium_polyedra.AAC.1
MHSDSGRAIRKVERGSPDEEAIGRKGGDWMVLANPWDEEAIQEAAVQGYALHPKPGPNQLNTMAR